MKLYTIDVGQGAFAVLVGEDEAIIIDTYVPSTNATDDYELENIKSALSTILQGKYLIGLIITGFDSDHFNIKGMKIILNRYRPEWIVYPKYFKETENANKIFKFLNEYKQKRDEQHERNTTNKLFKKIPIRIDTKTHRFKSNLSGEWNFEFFSPHWADMDNSNNCSLVAKVTAKKPQKNHFSYLITGDTENGRWQSIVDYFSNSIQAEVLAAPHHGSRGAAHEEAIKNIAPIHVLISAGYENKYGHPHDEAMELYQEYSSRVHITAESGSLCTYKDSSGRLYTRPIEF